MGWECLDEGDLTNVLIVLGDSFISKGVESLLSRERDLLVLSLLFEDTNTLNRQIESLKPDIIIMDEELVTSEVIDVYRLLSNNPGLCMLVLSMQDNRVSLYRREEILVSHSKDLITAIRTGL